MRDLRYLVLALGLFALSCSDATGVDDDTALEAELRFVRFPAGALDGVPATHTLWAVAGENREIRLRYPDGDEFLRFRISGNSLLRRPDGTAFQEGDSVRITITLDPAGRFAFDFQPSGLVFDPDHPAELEIRYDRTSGDLNGDGRMDGDDLDLERELDLWKQERPSLPWQRAGTIEIDEDLDRVEAEITGFTGFAIAA